MASIEVATKHNTISRVKGQLGLVREGLSSVEQFDELAKNHKMTPFFRYLDPANAKRFDRPMVDVSTPKNLLDERDHTSAAQLLANKGAYFSLNMGHFQGAQEVVPYTLTHHNSDFIPQAVLGSVTLFLNWYIARTQAGQSILGHPHTQWAHNIVFCAGILRAGIASTIAVAGSLYTYEYLYTYAPYFKIRNPSTNGWTRPFEEGQSTFLARAVSMAWFPLGAAFFTGSFKRFHFNIGVALWAGSMYELARSSGAGMLRSQLREQAKMECDKEGAAGSLTPSLRKTMDWSTGRMPNELNTQYLNSLQSEIKENAWKEIGGDILPMHSLFMKIRNHNFNWTFVKNQNGERAFRYKNDSWELPALQLDARSHTDAYDKKITISNIERSALNAAALSS